MKKVLLIGASSFIGAQLCVYLRKYYRLYGTFRSRKPCIDGVPLFRFAISPETPLQELLMKFQPHAVVYCAGERDEGRCTADPMGTLYLNSEAAGVIASTLAEWNGRLIYLSSSKVFSGSTGNYRESDEPAPISNYGRTKLAAETTLARYENVFILRLGTMYGIGPRGADSILNRMLWALWRREPTRLIENELRSFFSCDELTSIVGMLIDSHPEHAGIYHISNGETLSYYEFGKLVATVFGLRSDLLTPISGGSLDHSGFDESRRGANSTLDSTRFRETFYFRPKSTVDSLQNIRARLIRGEQ